MTKLSRDRASEPDSITAAQANRLFYADLAEEYDATEDCLTNPRHQARFRQAIYRALALAPGKQVLDACGGSGNAGVALATKGVVPVVVDVSSDMVELWRAKAHRLDLEPEIHVGTVEDFLHRDERLWDMITFCSALHHLEDPLTALELAVSRLARGGVIFTMFDPTPATAPMRMLRKLDWRTHLLVTNPRRFSSLAANAARRGARNDNAEAHVGRMAELHAYDGIDDFALRRRLEALGLTVCLHDRYVEARLGAVRAMLWFLRRPSQFSFVLRGPR